jgi:hypothetical protein
MALSIEIGIQKWRQQNISTCQSTILTHSLDERDYVITRGAILGSPRASFVFAAVEGL